jgi:hypothetical protein
MTRPDARQLIDGVFEDEALLVGGMAAEGDLEDDAVWRLIRGLDAIRTKTLRRLDEAVGDPEDRPSPRGSVRPHPAIETFLADLRRG